MRKLQHRNFAFTTLRSNSLRSASYLFTFAFLFTALFYSGCIGRIPAIISAPSRHEIKIPAEYNIAEEKNKKILVLVNQPNWLDSRANLRFYITEAINKKLIEKVEILPEYLVSYNELAEFRSGRSDFSLLSPVRIGAVLDADIVLLVAVENYQLGEMAETGIHRGFLGAQAIIFDVAAGKKLWPVLAKSKSIEVGFEMETRGRQVAVSRLATALAYCTVRYFYDCPKDKFKIADDKSHIGWENW